MRLERGGGFLVAMRREVVTDHDGSWLQLQRKDVADVGGEGISIHCPFDHPWRDQTVIGETCDKGLRAPCAEGYAHLQALAAQAASPQTGQVRFDRRFVNKHEPVRVCPHLGDAVSEPVLSQVLHTRAEPFGRDQ